MVTLKFWILQRPNQTENVHFFVLKFLFRDANDDEVEIDCVELVFGLVKSEQKECLMVENFCFHSIFVYSYKVAPQT